MDGPRIIYDAVKAKRSKAGLETKPFLQWAGIKQEVDRLVAGVCGGCVVCMAAGGGGVWLVVVVVCGKL